MFITHNSDIKVINYTCALPALTSQTDIVKPEFKKNPSYLYCICGSVKTYFTAICSRKLGSYC